jgi:hypothetical protein
MVGSRYVIDIFVRRSNPESNKVSRRLRMILNKVAMCIQFESYYLGVLASG